MDRTSPTPGPAQKLMHKFAPFRKRQLRYARSEDALSEAVPGVDGHIDSAQNLENVSESYAQMISTLIAKQHQGNPSNHRPGQKWSVWPTNEEPNQANSHSASPVPKNLPAYTPMPVPQRISSNREAVVYEQRSAGHHPTRTNHDQANKPHVDSDRDDISLGIGSAFDEDLVMQPRTPVSPLLPPKTLMPPAEVGESPVLGRLSNGSQQIPKQHRERPQGPPTPADSAPKEQGSDKLSLPGPRVLSPPASVASHNTYNLHVPSRLGPEALAQLQTPSPDKSDVLDTELILEDDPDSWDVINPNTRSAEEWDRQLYSLEKRAEQLYSQEHLNIILEDKDFHYKFSTFLRKYRPWRLPILEYYWDACKAIRAWDYANSLTLSLSKKPLGNIQPPAAAPCTELRESAQDALKQLLGDDLHWYIAQIYIDIVRTVMQGRITGTLPAPAREASHGLAEVFCITDPTRRDNPIILASQAFTRHSGCGMDYILGRNCRFMQGPGTTVDSCRRFAISMEERRDHSEIFVNYRRDGSPFLSLVMNAQLLDSRGNIRYYLGAQVDVSGLLKNCSGLESLAALVEKQRSTQPAQQQEETKPSSAIKSLSEMLSGEELDIIRTNGGLLKNRNNGHELQNTSSHKAAAGPARVLLADGSDDSDQGEFEAEPDDRPPVPPKNPATEDILTELNLRGVYKHYLIIRPAPSLRILFASPTLRVPSMLQSHFLHRIGGVRMRNDLDASFQEPKVVTAKVRWLKTPNESGEGEGSIRWIHCTPLMHHTGRVGLWMVVIVKPNESVTSVPSKAIRVGGNRAVEQSTSEMDLRRQDRGRSRYVT